MFVLEIIGVFERIGFEIVSSSAIQSNNVRTYGATMKDNINSVETTTILCHHKQLHGHTKGLL